MLENEYYRVSVDRATGRVEIWDKEMNRMVANDIEIAASEERGGDDLSIIPPTGRTIVNVINGVELEENGPVQTVMRITGDVAGIPIVQRLTLYQRTEKGRHGRPRGLETGQVDEHRAGLPVAAAEHGGSERHSVRIGGSRQR